MDHKLRYPMVSTTHHASRALLCIQQACDAAVKTGELMSVLDSRFSKLQPATINGVAGIKPNY